MTPSTNTGRDPSEGQGAPLPEVPRQAVDARQIAELERVLGDRKYLVLVGAGTDRLVLARPEAALDAGAAVTIERLADGVDDRLAGILADTVEEHLALMTEAIEDEMA